MHVKLADEAYALHGTTGPETYLVIEKIISIAKKSGANAVHPGYGFLAENADFARAVIAAGLVWIGPSPEAIEKLGDKVSARHVAEKVGAPLAPGTLNPVKGADEVLEFVAQHGVPVAIKAAYGGGGRGIKVAYKKEEVAELFESATREAIAAFGRGEWFGVGLGASVEKLLYLPEAHTDFLLAVIAEELGFVGVLTVIGLFSWIVIRAFGIAKESIANERYFAALLSQGLGVWIGVQGIINMGVNMGLLPTKGLTLPLLSFGGSGILANCIAMAILLRIDFENRRLQKGLPA